MSVLMFLFVMTGSAPNAAAIDAACAEVMPRVVAWRRDFHQHPELSNREFRTAEKVAGHLRELGIEVQTEVAHTGVVGILRGGKPGGVVGLRADMDGLPVTERVDLPFASKVRTTYNGQEVGVMHACGHDTHVAILMGAAQVLAGMREQIPGTIVFIFQPAEEGAPEGEEGGAELMVAEGVLKDPDIEVIFGLHISAQRDVGTIHYKKEGLLASVDDSRIKIEGRQSHGSQPWLSVDPIVTAAQIINSLQTIVSRELPLTEAGAVVTVGSIHGGVRSNIIPESLEMIGTIRALDSGMRKTIHEAIHRKATAIAESMGAKAIVEIPMSTSYPVTYNDPPLVDQMLPTLQTVAGAENVREQKAITGAEDFSFYAQEIPGFFFFLGGKTPGKPVAETAPHHTPEFFIDETGMDLGVRTMTHLALDYLEKQD